MSSTELALPAIRGAGAPRGPARNARTREVKLPVMVTDEPSQTTTVEAPPAATPGTPGAAGRSPDPREPRSTNNAGTGSNTSNAGRQTRADEPDRPPTGEPPPAHKRKVWPWLVAAAVLAIGAYVLISSHSRAEAKATAAKAQAAASAPMPVVGAAARTGDIAVYVTGLGSVTALNTATVKSRVDGQLMRIDYHEGQLVKEGELLAELDPRPFQVQLMQAAGQKSKDEAALQNAKVDLQRYQVLMQQDAIPKQQLDTQLALVKQDEAAIESDQAQVESAKLNLAYCRIAAPIGGRVGLRLVDTGNIVHAADATGIAVVNQVQPITVIFTIPADRLPSVLQQMHAGRQLAVDAFDRNNQTLIAHGVLAAVDNQIDQTTGTVRLRAVFPNQDDVLFPSQFVNARLLVDTVHDTVLVPTAALQRSPTATFVYHVKPDQTVEVRNVAVQLTEGDNTSIRSGLAAGDVVVTDGVDRLRPGAKVAVTLAAPGAAAGQGAPNGAANPAAPGAANAPNAPNAPNAAAGPNPAADQGAKPAKPAKPNTARSPAQ